MNITKNSNGSTLTLTINGPIDSSNAHEFQEAFESSQEGITNIMLDVTNMPYISSAGLRVLLMMSKYVGPLGGELKIIGVSPEVMSIFEITGFSELLNVELVKVNKYIITDMDGTLFDTEKVLMQCMVEIGIRNGLTDIEQAYLECYGLDEREMIGYLMKRYNKDLQFFLDAKQEALGLQLDKIRENGIIVKPYAKEALSYLKEQGYTIAIASSSKTPFIKKAIEEAGFLPYIDVFVGGENVTKNKPDPEIYLKGAEMLGCNIKDAYVFEDSPVGVEAGYAAGAKVLMIPDLVRPDEATIQKCEGVFKDFSELIEYFKKKEA